MTVEESIERPRRPSKKAAPPRCGDCGRRYGFHGPIRFRGKWVCGKCLVVADAVEPVVPSRA